MKLFTAALHTKLIGLGESEVAEQHVTQLSDWFRYRAMVGS